MMKQSVILFMAFLFCLGGCNTKNRSEEIKNYAFKEKTAALNEMMHQKIGAWAEEGTVCYGLVVLENTDGVLMRGLPVKSRIVSISRDSLKMKAMENVSLAEIKGCKKMGLSKGETWWEKDGELFKTKEEAEAFLRKKGLLMEKTK